LKISFAVVAYNEEKTLPQLLEDLCRQDYPHEKIEVLLIDSLSTDGTRSLMEAFRDSRTDFQQVMVLDNPNKTLPYGCNVALDHYSGDAIIRVDAHASIPADFLSKNVAVLESGEMVSGGMRPNIIDEPTPWKETLLIAEQSMFGSSVAAYRHSGKRQYVASVFHGMYRREVYDVVGRYDERLARTEDNDMSYRIRQAGYQICYSPNIVSYQHTRNTLKQMLRQKYLNGYWIGKTMGINPRCFSLFHFVPFAFVIGIVLTTMLALFHFPYLAMLMWGIYLALVFVISGVEIARHSFSVTNLLLPMLFFLLHVSYGWGTLVGLVEMPGWVRKIRSKT
jgi:glycosyltransferase involved in cell wall biosynthesis